MFRSTILILTAIASSAAANVTVNFNDHPLTTFDNGGPTPNSNGFVSAGAHLNNNFSTDFGPYWNGFALSAVADTTTSGYGNQYAAYNPNGRANSGTYAIGYEDSFNAVKPTIDLPSGQHPTAVDITNTTYTALSILNGNDYPGKKFGGATGNDPDFLKVTFNGFSGVDGTGTSTGAVDFYLADYRFANNTQDYIVKAWTTVDLSGLSAATHSITLSFVSSDNDPIYGINTPAYAALDNLVLVPEPATLPLLALPLIGRRRR